MLRVSMQYPDGGVPSPARPRNGAVASPSSKRPSGPRKARKPRAPGAPLPSRVPQRSRYHASSYEKFVERELGGSKQRKRGDGRKDKTVFKDRQGRYYRVPKPKPAPQDPPVQEEGYESCDDMDMQRMTRPLLQQAQQVESQLDDPALAALLAALCGQLRRVDNERRDLKAQNYDLIECIGSMKVKLSNKRAQLNEQRTANQNLHGQATRYWTRIRKLQRQLFRSKVDRFDPPPRKLSFRRPDD